MITVLKASEADFGRVYPLLQKFNNSYIQRDDWKKLFGNLWNTGEDFTGYMLMDDDTVVGFCGLLFNTRSVNDKELRFCNMNAWIVEDKYRDKSLLLLYQILRLKNCIITNLSPSDKVSQIMEKLNFKILENKILLLYPVPPLWSVISGRIFQMKVYLDGNIIKNKLNESDLKIFNDHFPLKCMHVLVEYKNDYCYLILNVVKRKRLPFGYIHYISNYDVFGACLPKLRVALAYKYKFLSLIIDGRFISGNKPFWGFTLKIKNILNPIMMMLRWIF